MTAEKIGTSSAQATPERRLLVAHLDVAPDEAAEQLPVVPQLRNVEVRPSRRRPDGRQPVDAFGRVTWHIRGARCALGNLELRLARRPDGTAGPGYRRSARAMSSAIVGSLLDPSSSVTRQFPTETFAECRVGDERDENPRELPSIPWRSEEWSLMHAHRTANAGHISARNWKSDRGAFQQRVGSRLAPRTQHGHITRGEHPIDSVDVSEEPNAPSELEVERECLRQILRPRRTTREEEHRRSLADLVENDPPRIKQRRVILTRVRWASMLTTGTPFARSSFSRQTPRSEATSIGFTPASTTSRAHAVRRARARGSRSRPPSRDEERSVPYGECREAPPELLGPDDILLVPNGERGSRRSPDEPTQDVRARRVCEQNIRLERAKSPSEQSQLLRFPRTPAVPIGGLRVPEKPMRCEELSCPPVFGRQREYGNVGARLVAQVRRSHECTALGSTEPRPGKHGTTRLPERLGADVPSSKASPARSPRETPPDAQPGACLE